MVVNLDWMSRLPGFAVGHGRQRTFPESHPMTKPTVENFRQDKYYPKVVRAVAAILAKGQVVTAIDVFVHLELLTRPDVESWRFGRVPYLEKVILCNLSKASRILRLLRLHVHDLNLCPSHTAYVKWGKGKRTPLRFSKTGDPNIEEAYSRHFLKPGLASKKRLPEQPALEGNASLAVESKSTLANLKPRDLIVGNPEDLAQLDWAEEWGSELF